MIVVVVPLEFVIESRNVVEVVAVLDVVVVEVVVVIVVVVVGVVVHTCNGRSSSDSSNTGGSK